MPRDQSLTDADISDPTSLRFVGPATAGVLEAAPFDASDILARRVSYQQLVTAGVNAGVAERMRREYTLVWTFVWIPGDSDLARRAEQLRVLNPGERAWIAASANGHADPPRESRAEDSLERDMSEPLSDRDWPAVDPDEPGSAFEAATCPRCAADTITYTLGEAESEFCEACGFTGVAADLGGDTPAWKTVYNRLLYGDSLP